MSSESVKNHIGPRPLPEMYQPGLEINCQCARCGSSMDYVYCDYCGGDGFNGHDCGEDCCCCLDPEDNIPCDICGGEGGWNRCMSSPEWCEANPLPGRKDVRRGEVEWFVIKEHPDAEKFQHFN